MPKLSEGLSSTGSSQFVQRGIAEGAQWAEGAKKALTADYADIHGFARIDPKKIRAIRG
jgi:hypothetical protein